MSQKQKGEPAANTGEERKPLPPPPPRSQQQQQQLNGVSPTEAPPVRRSWRPCQMLNQDGEPDPHHHHHHHHHHHRHHPPHHQPAGRGPPRQRRRPPSTQSHTSPLQEVAPPPVDSQDAEPPPPQPPRPVQHPRPAVTRYRRHGDPNPRVRRQRQPLRETPDSSPADEREGAAPAWQSPTHDTPRDQSQDAGSAKPPPVATPPRLAHTPADLPPTPPDEPEPDIQERDVQGRDVQESDVQGRDVQGRDVQERGVQERGVQERGIQERDIQERDFQERDIQEADAMCEEEPQYIQEEEEPETLEDSGEHHASQVLSKGAYEEEEVAAAEEREEEEEAAAAEEEAAEDEDAVVEEGEEEEEMMEDVADVAAQGSEITDVCSDTESAASLSMDGPLHSPPPLHSPTPPSSPEAPPFPQLDHLSEDASMSPLPDHDLPPEDEEEDEEEEEEDEEEEEEEDCSESCSLSHSTSCSEYYPKTYADFYSESHQKFYPEPEESYPKSKSHPDSFPKPLETSYPELPREPRRQSGRGEAHRSAAAHRGVPPSPTRASHPAPRPARERGPRPSPPDRSVGCRLHHYDGQSDSEGGGGGGGGDDDGSGDRSPAPHQRPHGEEAADEEAAGSGDAITLAIRDIRDAIEEVKTKTVRSPYTPDRPVEPIWVMRQEVSPSEEGYSPQSATGHSSPRSPSSQTASPSRYAASPGHLEAASPPRVESSRPPPSQHYHQPPPPPQHSHHHPHHHHHQSHHTHPPQPPPPPQQQQQRTNARAPLPQQQAYAHGPPAHQPPPPPRQQQQHQPPPPQPVQQPRPHIQPQSPPQQQPSIQEIRRSLPPFPTFVDVPGPCDPEDLIDGIIFAATYLGCTHLLSERTPTKSARMQQAQEAMSRVRAAQKQAKNRKKSPDSEAPSTAEVDLFMSTQRIKVLNADTQEALMDLPLRTISYIADIGNMVVLMARGKMVRSRSAQDNLEHAAEQTAMGHDERRLYRMICHVFESEDAQLIAQSIGQSFSVAYQEFLRANGIDPEDLSQREYSDLLNTQDMYNDDLIHFSKSENCRDVYIEKAKGEILGVVIVESGWGSILPTVIIASMMHAGPAEKSGRLNIGDQIMTINGTSLVGLPLSTCQSIIKGLKSQCRIKMNIVRCPPVTMVLIRRPDLRYQLGFSVQNGIICSLMRGGIAERGGVRVGHRIIEINSQSVVATPHEKIVQILSNAMGEIHMKTMPAAMYRLLTAQEQPVYI